MIGFITSFFNSYEISIPQIAILTVPGGISTLTTSVEGYSQFGKNVIIKNGVTDVDFTVRAESDIDFVASYMKINTGAIIFLAGPGTTLVEVDGTNKIDGAIGSTATLSRVNSTYYLRVNNV
jgi:hypothetical protein